MQLERQREEFEREGIRLAAVSFDSVSLLQHFAQRAGVKYPLLSDPESKIIRAFGILNDSIPESHRFHGIPYPGVYVIDAQGKVQAKYFEEKASDRFTGGHILVRQLDGQASSTRSEIETDYLRLTAWASDEIVRGGNRVALVLDVELKPKMHVYAEGVKGYIPVEWEMEQAAGLTHFPADFPESELLHLPAIDEIVPVYQNRFRVMTDVLLGKPEELQSLTNEAGEVVLKGSFRYQACDDKVCYLPQTVPIEWRFKLEPHDRTRAPEDLWRKAPR